MEPRAPETMLELLRNCAKQFLRYWHGRVTEKATEFAARACPGSRRYAAHYFRHHGSHACWSASIRYVPSPRVLLAPMCRAVFLKRQLLQQFVSTNWPQREK